MPAKKPATKPAKKKQEEAREGVSLTNLDQPLFDGADATKRDLVDYIDTMADRLIPVLRDRPLSVIRARPGQRPFMQKNVPKYTPDFVATVTLWAETSKRDVSYALANDRRTLLWFANQRAIEYHPALVRTDRPDRMTHLILDLDPPEGDAFAMAVEVAHAVRAVLADAGLDGAVKTSGAKGLHVFVPVDRELAMEDAAAATRAIAARAAARRPMSRRRHSSRTIGAGRSSSTPHGSAAARSSPRTAPACGRACPCRSRWAGTISTR